MSNTLTEILASQDQLLREAALALPHQFTQCTYSLGYIRQAVYLCLTCSSTRGICSACSIACHTEHEQIELFPKRHFRCDCPTTALSHACTLHKTLEAENTENRYGPNFKVVFCRCGRTYDAQTERETMMQCLSCEDWFHESCLNLRERPSSRETTPVANDMEEDADDAISDASSSGLPPPLIPGSEYESFVCASCVTKMPCLKKYAGTLGVMMVVRDNLTEPWRVLYGEETAVDVTEGRDDLEIPLGQTNSTIDGDPERNTSQGRAEISHKRTLSSTEDGPEPKRARVDIEPEVACSAPRINPGALSILKSVEQNDRRLGAGDLFLTEGFRDRWCRCPSCLPSLEEHPYLLKEEDTYEPPEDPDSGLSLEELGLRALQHVPRDRAIDGIRAFMNMRDDLMQYLRPFAAEGKEVNESDIQAFFDARREGSKS